MRSLPEWIGATDDTPIPARVKVRVFEMGGGRCVSCTLDIRGGLAPAYDHIRSIINGGENRESNIQLLCVPCHLVKTMADIKEKSRVYHKKAKHIGLKLKQGRPFPGSKNSKWKKMMNGKVVRR